jgi:hypothetical protein
VVVDPNFVFESLADISADGHTIVGFGFDMTSWQTKSFIITLYDIGDLNCDLVVDFADINPFVQRLTDPAGYAAAFPDCPDANGDINGDGDVNFGDINGFVDLLTR